MTDKPQWESEGETAPRAQQQSGARTPAEPSGQDGQSAAAGAPSYGSPNYEPPSYGSPGPGRHAQPTYGQPGEPEPGHGEPGRWQSGYDQPGSQQPGSQQPGPQQPSSPSGSQQPSSRPTGQQPIGQQPSGPGGPQQSGQQPGYPQPGYQQQPGYPQPGAQQPGAQQPSTQQAGYQSGYPQSGPPQSGFQQPGFQQPGFQQPGFQQPGYAEQASQRPRRSRRRTGLIAAIAGAVVLALVVVVGAVLFFQAPGLRTADGDLDGTGPALETVQTRWTKDLKTEGFTPPSSGECYFTVTKSSNLASNLIACGPFLRPETAKANVWDLFAFSRNSDGNVRLAYTEPVTAAPLPSGSYLADGSGREQNVDTSDLKAAPYPSAAASSLWAPGSFSVSPGDVTGSVKLPANPTLVGFSAAYQVESVSKLSKAALTDDKPRTVQAPKGQSLYLITFGAANAANTVKGTNKFSIQNGDNGGVAVSGDAGTQVLATAGNKGLVMKLETDGIVQTLDLLSGKRVTDPRTDQLAARAWPITADRNIKIAFPGVTGSDSAYYTFTLTVDDVYATPYQDGVWAPPGQLLVESILEGSATSTRASGAGFTLDCTATVNGGAFRSCTNRGKGFANLAITVPMGADAAVTLTPTMHVTRGTDKLDVSFPARPIGIPLP